MGRFWKLKDENVAEILSILGQVFNQAKSILNSDKFGVLPSINWLYMGFVNLFTLVFFYTEEGDRNNNKCNKIQFWKGKTKSHFGALFFQTFFCSFSDRFAEKEKRLLLFFFLI